jgi:hypothetical protein
VEEVIESMLQCMTTFPAQDMFEIKEWLSWPAEPFITVGL